MVEQHVEVVNSLGLHARAAARFVRAAARFNSRVTVSKDEASTDGKSILGILFLAASFGSKIVIAASGDDEDEAVKTLSKLVADGLGEEPRNK